MESVYQTRGHRTTAKITKPKIIIVGNVDYIALLCVILLVLVGIVMVFSSSYYNVALAGLRDPKQKVDIFSLLKKQSVFAVIGFLSMAFLSNFNYKYLRQYTLLLYIAANLLLVLVLFFGVEANGAKRWLLVAGFQFQPSEVAKMAIILFLSHVLAKNYTILKRWGGYVVIGFVLLIPVALIGIENLSTAIIATAIGAGIMFVASPHVQVFVIGGIAGIGGVVSYLAFFAKGFRGNRFLAWQDPFAYAMDTGYQTVQSLYAIASGGLFGLGLGQSRQKLGYIPEAQNDIIFSIICEELGFVGATIILIIFAVFIWRGIKIAMNAPDLFSAYVATGVVVMIAMQVIINVAVVTNTIPNTGVPLPFISYGGTSLIVFMSLVGILLNISRYSKA